MVERYIIRVYDDVDIDAFASELTNVHLILHRVHMVVSDMESEMAEFLKSDERVKFVEVNELGEGAESGGTQQINNEWQLDRIDQRSLPLDGEYTWTYDGDGVRVYIIDTGIHGTHEAFAGRLGPGYSALAAPFDDPYEDTDTSGVGGHGTKVAGVAAGATTGPARGATICSVKFAEHSGTGGSSSAEALDAINWIISEETSRSGRAVVVFSYSFRGSSLGEAFQDLIDIGVPVFVSAMNAGNQANDFSGGTDTIIVSGSEIDDSWAGYNYGSRVDLIAPARDIWTTRKESDNEYGLHSGTSYAAPLTAAVAAKFLEMEPDIPFWKLRLQLKEQATEGAITGNLQGTPNLLLYSQIEPSPLVSQLQIKTGSFTIPSSTGTQDITWNLGDDWSEDAYPEAIILFGIGINTEPLNDNEGYNNIRYGFGFGTQQRSRQHSLSATSSNNFNNVSRRASGAIFETRETGLATDRNAADYIEPLINGFRLSWLSLDMGFPHIVNYIAISGPDIQASVQSWQFTGNAENLSITDVGFEPDIVLHAFSRFDGNIGGSRQTATGSIGFGVMLADGTQWATGTQIPAGGASSSTRMLSDEHCLIYPSSTLTVEPVNHASFVSMDEDGFTVLIDGIENSWGLSLAIKGGEWRAGLIEQPSSDGVQQITLPEMNPLALLFSTVMTTDLETNDNAKADAFFSLGFGSREENRSVSILADRGSNDHKRQFQNNSAIIVNTDYNFNVSAQASVTDLDDEEATIVWSDPDNTGAMIGYLAIGYDPVDDPVDPPHVHSWTVTSSVTAQVSTRTLNVPDHEPGDLLVTVIGAVSGTGSYSYMTHPDWNEHLTHDGAAPSSILWRIASENEPVSYTFEDVNSQTGRRAGAMVCIKNADQRIPFTDAEIKSSGGDEWNFPDMRAVASNSLILALTHNHGVIMTAPNEFTSFYSDNPSGVRSHGFYKEASAVGPLGPYTFTRDGTTADGGVALMVIQPPTDQYIFDFEKDAVGEQPPNTTNSWDIGSSTWAVREKSSPFGNHVLEFSGSTNGRRLLSFDAIGQVTDVEIVAMYRSSSTAGNRGVLAARGSGTGVGDKSAYLTWFQSTNFFIGVMENDSTSTLSFGIGETITANVWHMIRLRVNGSTIQSKSWLPGDPEPENWHSTDTDTTITGAGWVGVTLLTVSGTQDWAFIGVGVDGASAPLPLIEQVVEPPPTPDNLTATLTAWDTVHLTADPGTES